MSSKSEFGLKRTLGLPGLIAIAVGQTIGAGIFVLTGMAIEFTGPSVILAYALAVIPIAFLMLLLAMLGASLPVTGGNYRYSSRLFSPRAAFLGIWVYIAGALLGAFPLYALSAARYLQAIFDWPTVPVALAILTGIFLINILGLSLATAIQGGLVLLLISSLFYFTWSGFPTVSLDNFEPFMPQGYYGLALATSILTFTYMGANAIVELGGEIKNPRQNIPRAFLFSIPLVTVFYLLVVFVAAGAVPWEISAGQPLTASAEIFMGRGGLNFFVFAGGVVAITTTLNASFMWGTKSLLVMTADGFFPSSLLAVNRRFGTPHWFLTIIYLASSLAIIVLGEEFLETFTILGSLGGIIIFLPLIGAAVVLPRRAPRAFASSSFRLPIFWLYFSAGIGLLLALIIIIILLVDLYSQPLGVIFSLLFLLWIIAGLIYFQVRENSLRQQGRSLLQLARIREEDF